MSSDTKYERYEALIAHPNRQLTAFMRQFLRDKGFGSIIQATGSRDAVKRLKRNKTRLLIVDYDLPDFGGADFGGADFVKFVRICEGPLSEAAVCIVISKPNRQKVLAARDAGANEVFALPLTLNAAEQKITRALEDPAPFIRVPTYTGPCRRRISLDDWGGGDRRGTTKKIEAPKVIGISEILSASG